MIATPEFVLWTLARPCGLREPTEETDPERAIRRLHALQACGAALFERREFEGICIEAAATSRATCPGEPLGFRADEILEAYGGTGWVQSQCASCPANLRALYVRTDGLIVSKTAFIVGSGGEVRSETGPCVQGRWAGCVGLVDWSHGERASLLSDDARDVAATRESVAAFDDCNRAWFERVEKAAAGAGIEAELSRHFLVTRPRWYGLWASSPLSPVQLELLEVLLERLVADDLPGLAPRHDVAGLDDLRAAIVVARRENVPLHVQYGPRGEVFERTWFVAAHCGRCRAAREPQSRRCGVCGQPGPAEPARRRQAKGTRPYGPLSRFLGADGARQFLDRYWRRNESVG